MPLPTYDEFIEPLLRTLVQYPDGLRAPEAYELVAIAAGLTEQDKVALLPSGRQAVFKNRIGWAHDRLKRAGYSSSPRRALWIVTEAGRALATRFPRGLPPEEVERIASVPADSRLRAEPGDAVESSAVATVVAAPAVNVSPEERIEASIQEIHGSVAADLLDAIGDSTPAFFERLVLDLLHALGYGIDPEALQQVGKSGDGGIDGIISLDRLGFEKVYVQAKRWQNTVGRPEIQAFYGALAGHHATKGVFITTSRFTREALDYATKVAGSLVLVDGARLTSLMIAHGVGVQHRDFRVAKIDTDYFEEG